MDIRLLCGLPLARSWCGGRRTEDAADIVVLACLNGRHSLVAGERVLNRQPHIGLATAVPDIAKRHVGQHGCGVVDTTVAGGLDGVVATGTGRVQQSLPGVHNDGKLGPCFRVHVSKGLVGRILSDL